MRTRQVIAAAAGLTVAGALLSLGGCATEDEKLRQRTDSIIQPAALPYALTQLLMVDVAGLKREGRLTAEMRLDGYEGRKIALWLLAPRGDAGPKGTIVLLHPLLAGKSWLFDHAEVLAERGWYVVLPDLPAHGMSDGPYVTWGAKEKYDIRAVVDALLSDGTIRRPLYVGGVSLGAMVAIQYAAVDDRCRGVLAVAPPIDCATIARRILLLDSEAECNAALARAAEKADFDPRDASAGRAAAELDCPLILAHGLLDSVVPYEWSERIIAAHEGPERLVTLPLDGHALEVGRDEWLADRIEELAALAGPATRPATTRPATGAKRGTATHAAAGATFDRQDETSWH
ncbi:MAG: alpha/beta fold hydrolase [Phycisphaerae bacterium]|nr:alpha/beta fold hydrolase [Phycisphaerae bacterium]